MENYNHFLVGLSSVSLGLPRLHSVVRELQEMCGWALLGLCFGLSRASLVELTRESEELSKISLISSWLSREKDASWKTLISALCNAHRKHLAVRIAEKYGKPITTDVMYSDYMLVVPYLFYIRGGLC